MKRVLVLLAACTPSAIQLDAQHPANPQAEPGRLAGPPTALRPGVVTTAAPKPDPKPDPKPAEHQH